MLVPRWAFVAFASLSLVAADVHAGDALRFARPQLFSVRAFDVALGDLDRDGLVDVVLAASFDGQVRLHRATGPVTFEPHEALVSVPGSIPFAVRVVDLDGDGLLDVLSLDSGSGAQLRGAYRTTSGGFVHTALPLVDVAAQPSALGLGDVTGDGRPDALVGDLAAGTVSVLPALAPLGFELGDTHATGRAPTSIAVGDVDEDGLLDFATSNFDDGDVSVLLNLGAATFAAPLKWTCLRPQRVLLRDLDGDGHLDLLCLGVAGPRVRLGAGDGTFGAELFAPLLNNGEDAELVDFDLDGDLDVLVAQRDGLLPGRVWSVPNDGTGLLGTPHGVRATGGLRGMAVADLDNDAIPDIVVSSGTDARTTILRGRGDGTFVTPSSFPVNPVPVGPLLADFDLDGDLDAAIGRGDFDKAVTVYPGSGQGSFGPPVVTLPASPVEIVQPLAAADVNEDGRPDLVCALGTETVDGLRTLEGAGDLSFAIGTDSDLGDRAEKLQLVDLDGDGHLDVVTLAPFLDAVQASLGDGTGAFVLGASVAVPAGDVFDLAVGDVDLDGFVDAFAATSSGHVASFAVTSTAGLVPGPLLSHGVAPVRALALSDLEADGWPDLVVVSPSAGLQSIHVYPGQGSQTFGSAQVAAQGLVDTLSVRVADLDDDGHADLAAAGKGLVLVRGHGDLSFDAPRRFAGGATSCDWGDLDGDGLLDAAVVDQTDDVLLGLTNDLYGSWWNLGRALPGPGAVPRLVGRGSMLPGSSVVLRMSGALPNASVWLVLGLSELAAPFRGGVLVPAPDLVLGASSDGDGSLLLPMIWPAGLPGGASLYWQIWVADAAGPAGFTSTNGLWQVLP